MSEKSCDSDQHEWVCHQTGGNFDEKLFDRPLTLGEVTSVQTDPNTSENVCPGGIIICKRCQVPLVAGQKSKGTVPNASTIASNLE